MASVILVVGFMGMIQAVILGSEMMATARRQTLAQQILDHEMEVLRQVAWSTTTTINGTTYTGGINGIEAGTSGITIDSRFNDSIAACGLAASDITLSRTTTDIVSGELKEITFTLTWTKGGTATAASTPTGTWLERLAFYRETPIARTYTRKSTTWIGKYGLNHAIQRS